MRYKILLSCLIISIISIISITALVMACITLSKTFKNNREGYKKDSITDVPESNVAFVTGFTGCGTTPNKNIPTVPRIGHSYFLSNLAEVRQSARSKGWIPIETSPVQWEQWDISLNDVSACVGGYVSSSMASKPMKVFPQTFLPSKYTFVVWFDNKFNVNVDGVDKQIKSWNPNTAIMFHKHPHGRNAAGAKGEWQVAQSQQRYREQKK